MSAESSSRIARLLSPLLPSPVLEFWAGRLNPLLSLERVRAEVVESRVEARDTVTLLLQPNRLFRGFRPGQHVNVTVEVNGARLTRSYSLSDRPRADGRLAITVRQEEGGKVSTQLCQHTRPGDIVELGQAFGEMTLPDAPAGDFLLLAAGSGITPLMSLTRALLAGDAPVCVTLAYWAQTRAELCFLNDLQALAANDRRFRLLTVLTREPVLLKDELSGRLSAEFLAAQLPTLATQQVMACGPFGFADSARQLLQGRVRSFAAEAFTLPQNPDADTDRAVTVTLTRSARTVTLSSAQTLLEGLEAQGIRPESGCRMGICHTCSCRQQSGSSRNRLTGDVQDEAGSQVRLCVSRPQTDLVLDL